MYTHNTNKPFADSDASCTFLAIPDEKTFAIILLSERMEMQQRGFRMNIDICLRLYEMFYTT